MDSFLEFAKGPLFRLSFGILCLGLLRLIILTVINGLETIKQAKDKAIPKSFVRKLTLGYVFPIRAFRTKPFYSLISIIFHIGLLFTPLFLFDHALLFERSISFSWIDFTISKEFADTLTIITLIAGVVLLLLRVTNRDSRFISRKQDILWLILLMIPFITGLICAQIFVSPDAYNWFILIHVLSGNLIFILIPFTKIAHCVLIPFSQWITARVWKFRPEGGEEVQISLGKQGEKL